MIWNLRHMGGRRRRLRLAATLILLGLIAEWISLSWNHPTAFFVFAAATGSSLGLGLLLFLSTLFQSGPSDT